LLVIGQTQIVTASVFCDKVLWTVFGQVHNKKSMLPPRIFL
jgi:hypothetical protein